MHRWILCAVIFAVAISISWEEAAAYAVKGDDKADIDPKEPTLLVLVDPVPVKEDSKEEPEVQNTESTAKPPQTTEISREEMTEEEKKKKPQDASQFFIITGRH